MKALIALLMLVQLTPTLAPQTKKPRFPPVIDLPRGPVTRISSPDRKWTLIFECPDYKEERKLWIEESSTHKRRLIREYERSLSIGWAPDSQLFFVNDASGSNETLSYVFNPVTLTQTALADVLLRAVPRVEKYLVGPGHYYLEAKRWVNSHELLVTFEAYLDESPPVTPGFSGTYRVDVNGAVRKVSEHFF
jgi:hypothetical protein